MKHYKQRYKHLSSLRKNVERCVYLAIGLVDQYGEINTLYNQVHLHNTNYQTIKTTLASSGQR